MGTEEKNFDANDPSSWSAEYRDFRSRLDAWTLWDEFSPAEKRDHILDYFSAEEWSKPEYLTILAVFFDDAPQWMRIKARGKAIGVNVWDLERACKTMHERAQEASKRARDSMEPHSSQSSEDRLKALFASTELDDWYGALDLLADIFPQAAQWNYAKEMAKRRGISAYGLEQAVKEVVAVRKKAHASTAATSTADASLSAQSYESALMMLSEEWDIPPISACVRHGTENSTWHLKFADGREVNLGTSKDLLNELSVRAAILDVTKKVIRFYGKKDQERWRELIGMLTAVAMTVDTPEMTPRGQAHALVEGYLEMNNVHLDENTSAEEWETLAYSNEPFVRDGIVHVSARHICNAYARTMMPEIDHKVTLELLRLLGGYQVRITLNTYKTSRSMFAIPVENIAHSQE